MRGLFLGAILIVSVSAASASELIDGRDPARVLAVARTHGEAALRKDGLDEPMIDGRIEDTQYRLYFYDCKKRRDCKSLMFSAAWDAEELTEKDMARWNRSKRFGKALIGDDDRAKVEMNVNLHGGVSEANLDDTFDWWRLVLEEFVADHDL